MMRLQMVTTRPVVWLFGDEAANDFRDEVKNLQDTDIDIRCFAYTGATLESVMDAQLLMAIGTGTSPAAIIVASGAYDALIVAMGGGNANDAAAQIATKRQRLNTILRMRSLGSIPLLVHSSLQNESLCTKIGIPSVWAEQVCHSVCDEPNAPSAILETLLLGLGCRKDSADEPS